MNLLHRVQTVKGREACLDRLLPLLTPALVEVVTDEGDEPNPWRGYQRCLRDIPEGVTHLVVIQDDALPCQNYAPACERIVRARPDNVVCLFLPGSARNKQRAFLDALGHHSPFCVLSPREFLPVVACIWPVEKASDLLEWAQTARLPGYPRIPRSDDAIAGTWQRQRRETVLVTVPSIVQHPDVKRMLLTMKATAEATRALAYWVSALLDRARKHPDEATRRENQALVDLLIPVVKGWSTENGIEVASLGIQVHGGMGFIEETGAAQHLRDARITTIYEGTTGIQAMDLVGRKIGRDGGAAAKQWIAEVRKLDAELARHPEIRRTLADGVKAVEECVQFIVEAKDPRAPFAGAVPFLKLMGIAAGGWQMARAALAAGTASGDDSFYKAKIATARFFADHVLVQAPALRNTVVNGAAGVMALSEDQFLAA